MSTEGGEVIDVRGLASLARIAISDTEAKALEQEMRQVLAFVSEIKEAGGEVAPRDVAHRNVLRADAQSHEPGAFTEALLDAAPRRKGQHVAVRQVLDRGEGTKK